MKPYLLPKPELPAWLARVQEHRRLLAPLPDADGVLGWREVTDPAAISLEPGVPDLPLKQVFTRLSETLLRYG